MSSPEKSKAEGRGNYRCGRCGVPKKGHKCPYQPKLKRKPGEAKIECKDMDCQCEIGEEVVRGLEEIQGTEGSYKRIKMEA